MDFNWLKIRMNNFKKGALYGRYNRAPRKSERVRGQGGLDDHGHRGRNSRPAVHSPSDRSQSGGRIYQFHLFPRPPASGAILQCSPKHFHRQQWRGV